MNYSKTSYILFNPIKSEKKSYLALVHSPLTFGIEISSFANKTTTSTLHIICNNVLRALQGVDKFYNVKQLYLNYNVLPVKLLSHFCIAKHIFISINFQYDDSSNPAYDLFRPGLPVHRYSTRLSETNYLFKENKKTVPGIVC